MASYSFYEKKAAIFLGNALEKSAQDLIGHLQNGAGPFAQWDQLAESTKRDKERKGYVFNSDYNPLYRTGELKNSISSVFNPTKRALYIGSTDKVMEYMEKGTRYMPARSVIGLNMYKSKERTQFTLKTMLYDWITARPTSKRWQYGSV